MKTGGTKKQTDGNSATQHGDSAWEYLADALEDQDWIDFQKMIWRYDGIPSNSPSLTRTSLNDIKFGEYTGVGPNKKNRK